MKAGQFVLLGLVVVLVGLSFWISGSNLMVYVDLPSAVIVFGMSYLASLAAHGPAGLGRAYGVAVRGGSREECLAAVAVFDGLQKHMILAGVFGMITGMVAILTFVEEMDSVAKGAAVAVLTGLYTLVAILVLVAPFRASAAEKAALQS